MGDLVADGSFDFGASPDKTCDVDGEGLGEWLWDEDGYATASFALDFGLKYSCMSFGLDLLEVVVLEDLDSTLRVFTAWNRSRISSGPSVSATPSLDDDSL